MSKGEENENNGQMERESSSDGEETDNENAEQPDNADQANNQITWKDLVGLRQDARGFL